MKVISFNKRTIHSLDAATPYLTKVKQICLDWLEGTQTFSLMTSGSTGAARRIVVNSDQLRASVAATSKALSLFRGTKAFVCLNVNYVGGFMMLIRAMELDWEVSLVEPSGNPLTEIPEELNFDFTAMAPMQLWEITSNAFTAAKANKLGKILLGGVGLTLSQGERFRKLEQEIYIGYGMTETVSHVALQKLSREQPSTNVYTLTGEVRFGTDSRGCLFFKGPVTNHELIQTNDLADLLPDGKSFRLIGRTDNTVNSGGIKIQLEEMEPTIEKLLSAQEIFAPFFLWKVPDERLGESLVMVVEGDPELESAISAILQAGVERHKKPRKIYFTKEFSRTGSGKPDKSGTFEKLS